jgi:radical SAM family uncharacterized protein/radical SAM-linked protein
MITPSFSAPEPSLTLLEQLGLIGHPYASFLAHVEKPGRYLGGEEQAVIKKDWSQLGATFVLAFPDLYEIGMSHLGTRILYDLINRQDDLVCERAFAPWPDLEAKLRDHQVPLVSLETYRPLRDFDVVGLSLQYELSYTNALLNLDLGGIPLRSADRSDRDPIVLGGGPTSTHPEPLAPFVDAFLVGEAEEVLPQALRAIGALRRAGAKRFEVLAAIAKIRGFYVPCFYEVATEPRTGLQVVIGLSEAGKRAGAPESVARVYVRDLEDFPFPTRFPVPYAQAIFDRASVEITRGCTEGCRFCQAGMIYRPVRERKPESILKTVLESTDHGGFEEASLTALSTADVSCIDPLIRELVPELAKRKVSLGIASLRAYGLNEGLLDEIKKVGIDGLTFAPEAGTQRMRNVINKNVSEEDIMSAARRIFERDYDRMKMYFIVGLPTETEEDVVGIIETAKRVRTLARQIRPNREAKITASVSQHVPKPHTPFQWAAMDTPEELESKVDLLWKMAKRDRIPLKTHNVRESWLECLFARGDRKMGDVLERAYRNGARFDGWKEHFRFEVWLDAIAASGVDPINYTQTLPMDVPLPWSHLDMGLEPGFLASEYKKALASRLSPPCGKPAGAKVHHTELHGSSGALAEKRRLVCYDCGIACDLSEMKTERIAALGALESRRNLGADRDSDPESEQALVGAQAVNLVPLDRLKGRLPKAKTSGGEMHKSNAEAPYSRLRLFFAKTGTTAFLGHLDLVRILPRMMRRSRIELAFTRGYTPLPRMSFSPALALGMAAGQEVVDCDVILDESARDMLDEMSDSERKEVGDRLVARLREHAPPGLLMISGRLVGPNEFKISELIDGAIYEAQLDSNEISAVQARVADFLASDTWLITRERNARAKGANAILELDLRELVVDASVDPQRNTLRFMVLQPKQRGSARPREIVQVLVGRSVEENKMARLALVHRDDDRSYQPLASLGPTLREVERHSMRRPSKATVEGTEDLDLPV